MSIASDPERCPKCGAPIPPEAPQGLCPKCLLLQASMATETAPGTAGKPAPPTVDELAQAFPQLDILELIGQGGMGFVFKARQPKLDRFVALKILPQSLAADPAFAERFTREGRVLAKLSHPNIVTIHDFGQANGFFYLLMEFVDGVNLRQAMQVGRFTPEQALAIVPKICEALQFAHNEGILHRDIKPENILLDTRGRVKIADFGIAKLVGPDIRGTAEPPPPASDAHSQEISPAALTQAGKVLGTPQYMAPEQLERPGDIDHRADIYSLGVVFYEMLTGELPTGRFAPPSKKSGADPRVDKVVLRALEKERERRPQSAEEVRTQVETISTGPSAKLDSQDSKYDGKMRWSRSAIVGACWASCFLLLALGAWGVARGAHPVQGFGRLLLVLSIVLLPLGLTAPFGTTILGWIGVGQIRRSAGRLQGLGLAVFDGLLFPVLALDVLIGWVTYVVVDVVGQAQHPGMFPEPRLDRVVLLSILISIGVDAIVARSVWRAVKQWVAGWSALPISEPAQHDNSVLGYTALCVAGTSGFLGVLAFLLWPAPPVLVWSILACGIGGVVMGISSRKVPRGKQAIVVGSLNIAIWLAITAGCLINELLKSPESLLQGLPQFFTGLFLSTAAGLILSLAAARLLRQRDKPSHQAPPRPVTRPDYVARGMLTAAVVFALTTGAMTVLTFIMPETYRGTARVLLSRQVPANAGFGDFYDPYQLATEFEVVRSEIVLTRVVQQLELTRRWSQRFARNQPLGTPTAVEMLGSRLELRPVRNTMVIEISAFSDRREEAAELANAVTDTYVAYRLDQIREWEQSGEKSLQPPIAGVQIVDRASVPSRPVRPNKPVNLVVGAVLGFGLGLFAGVLVGLISYWRSHAVAAARLESPPVRSSKAAWVVAVVIASGVLLLMLLLAVIALMAPLVTREYRPDTGLQILRDAPPMVRQIGPPFVARLPEGTVELVAVSHHPSAGQWWMPDGSPYTGSLFAWGSHSTPSENQIARQFVFRLSGVPDDASWPAWKMDLPMSMAGGEAGHEPGAGASDLRALSATMPAATRTVTLSAGVAIGRWETVAEQNAGGAGMSSTSRGDQNWTVSFTRPGDVDGHPRIHVAHTVKDRDVRVVAVDRNGVLYVASRAEGSGTDAFSELTATFNQLSTDQVAKYQFQVRPYYWVEFRNVSVIPGQHTDVQAVDAPETAPAASVTGNILWPKTFSAEAQARVVRATLNLLRSCSFSQAATESGMAEAMKLSHIRLAFKPDAGEDLPEEIVVTFPLTSGSVWTRTGATVTRHAKYTPDAAAALAGVLKIAGAEPIRVGDAVQP